MTNKQKPLPSFSLLVLACFFISGFTGLVYEILWTRLIVKIIGSAPFSVSIVLTVFMGGLGIGSYLAGKKIDRVKNPMRLVKIYGALELFIAAYGLLLPLLLKASKPLFSVLYNQCYEYFWFYNLTTLIGCFFLLILPAICMGATLPVLCRFFLTNINDVGRQIGNLYGLNTIGAAFGSLCCGFWLISWFGVWGSMSIAVSLNIFIGVLCLVFAGKQIRSAEHAPLKTETKKYQSPLPVSERKTTLIALLIFAISGFAAMAYEVIWIKLLGLIIGPTTYSFTIVLVTFICCLALGSLFFGKLADEVEDTLFLLVMTQICAVISALFVSQLLGNSQFFFSKLIFTFRDSFAVLQIVQALTLFFFLSVPTFCLGATFPLVGKICTQSLENTGNIIGTAYAVNTVGAVLGSFTAGFVLIPFFGKENGVRIVAALQLMVPILAIALLTDIKKKREKWIPGLALTLIAVIALSVYPAWNRKMLARGKYQRTEDSDIQAMGWAEPLFRGTEMMSVKDKSELIYFGDGVGGFTTVLKSGPDIFGEYNYSMLNSGKADASNSKKDMYTQVLLAHFPMMFHGNPKDVLILGLASGITSGEILHYPIEKLDTVEINQQVVEASHFFTRWNNDVLNSPKTNLIIQDGRAHLELTESKYDVIISEPSNPWMAGLASLFTHEFMTLAKNRLNRNGIFVQWVHSYQMNWETFSLIGRTFADVFPNSLIVSTRPHEIGEDFLLVGFRDDYNLDPAVAEKKSVFAGKSKNMTLQDGSVMYRHIQNENLEKLFGDGELNTDSRPLLEFSAPKLLHAADSSDVIARVIKERYSVRETTAMIIEESNVDIDKRIDYIAYLLSFGIIYPGIDNIPGMSPAQRKELENYLIAYSRENQINDFNVINDNTIRKNCIRNLLGAANVKEYKDKALLNYYLGHNCINIKMYDEAINYFSEVIKINPQYGDVRFYIGHLFYAQQKYQLAEIHLQEVTQNSPNYQKAQGLLGQTMGILAQIDTYIEDLKKKAETSPHNHLVNNSIADLYKKMGNMENAIAYYNKTIAIQPDFFSALQNLAFIHALRNENNKSIAHFKKMVEIKPAIPLLYYNIACLYSKENQIDKSISWLEMAIQKGFNSWKEIETDEDFSNIKNTRAFNQLKAKYRG